MDETAVNWENAHHLILYCLILTAYTRIRLLKVIVKEPSIVSASADGLVLCLSMHVGYELVICCDSLSCFTYFPSQPETAWLMLDSNVYFIAHNFLASKKGP